ncbi:MAG: DUF4097 family beta strand repeat-containing protein [Chloroflexi bacterium]|nr:DUF4097 family beta strand repeat-containing protein [Chloroflexota bacterium]
MRRTVELRDADGLEITTRSGSLVVIAEEGRVDVEVDGLDEQAKRKQIWREKGRLHIRSGRGSNALTVKCPPATHVLAGSDSGRVDLRGDFGNVKLKSGSSKISVDSARSADVKTRDGKIEIARTHGRAAAGTISGTIVVGHARSARAASVSGRISLKQIIGSTEAMSVSGKIDIASDGAGDISAATVSGGIKVRIPKHRAPEIKCHRKSGSLDVDCTEGNDLTITVATVSGAIKVGTH